MRTLHWGAHYGKLQIIQTNRIQIGLLFKRDECKSDCLCVDSSLPKSRGDCFAMRNWWPDSSLVEAIVVGDWLVGSNDCIFRMHTVHCTYCSFYSVFNSTAPYAQQCTSMTCWTSVQLTQQDDHFDFVRFRKNTNLVRETLSGSTNLNCKCRLHAQEDTWSNCKRSLEEERQWGTVKAFLFC